MREKITTSGRIKSSMKAPRLCSRPSHWDNRFGQAASRGFMVLFINHRSCVLHCRVSRGDVLKFSPPWLQGSKIETQLCDHSERFIFQVSMWGKHPFFQCAASPWKSRGRREGLCPANVPKPNYGDGDSFTLHSWECWWLSASWGADADMFPSDPSGREMAAKFPKVIKIYLQQQEKTKHTRNALTGSAVNRIFVFREEKSSHTSVLEAPSKSFSAENKNHPSRLSSWKVFSAAKCSDF